MTPPEETTLEQDLAAAIAEHKAAETPAEPVVEPEAVQEPEAAETPSSGPERDESGRFKPKAAEEPAAEPTAEEPKVEPVIPDRYALAPTYAKKGIRDNWKDLPLDVRSELHEREREFHQQLTRNDEDRSFGKKVKEVVGPYEGFIKGLGADPVQAVDYLIKTDYALRTAPPEQRKAMFIKAAADYGITFGEAEFGAHTPVSDPRVETMHQRIERLEREQQSAIQARQLAEQQTIEQQIADFAADPAHVYFDRVSPFMGILIQSGQAKTLPEAYEMAVYADPETRALQLATKAPEQSQRSEQDKAQAARRASASVTGAPGLAVPASQTGSDGSLEDDIRHAIRASDARI